jgi:hypothetical protein
MAGPAASIPLATPGEPVWVGYGRGKETLRQWLDALSDPHKRVIELFATDLCEAFRLAVRETPGLEHVAIAHDWWRASSLPSVLTR